jgi:enoyl-CoA hydratase/carnithine racemase
MEPYTAIAYDVSDAVATITLDRPHARNGYTPTMADELRSALDAADRDDEVRAVVLTGAGKDFCVGADLSGGGFALTPSETQAALLAGWQEPAGRVTTRMYAMNTPVIAALNGAAAGGGLTITLAADFRLAATDSKLGFVFPRRGIVGEGCSHWLLPRLVGQARAMDWMLTGRVFGAAEALQAGLLHSVHPPRDLLDAAYALARGLVEHTAPVAVAVSRRLLYEAHTMTLDEVHALESRLVLALVPSADAAEGVTSFLQRRAPSFPGVVSKDLPPFLPWS